MNTATTAPHIPVQEVESSQIHAIGHDAATNTLAIRFKSRTSGAPTTRTRRSKTRPPSSADDQQRPVRFGLVGRGRGREERRFDSVKWHWEPKARLTPVRGRTDAPREGRAAAARSNLNDARVLCIAR